MNVPDVGCITVDEPQLLHTDAATQEMKQGDLNSLSLVSIHFIMFCLTFFVYCEETGSLF